MKKISRLTALLLALLLIFQMTAVATEVSGDDVYISATPIPEKDLDVNIFTTLSEDATTAVAALDVVRGMGITANAETIPFRKEAHALSGVWEDLPAGTYVQVYDSTGVSFLGKWYKVHYNGNDGFIHNSRLNICACSNADAPLAEHADACPDKGYVKFICDGNSAENLYAIYTELPEAFQMFVLTYLDQNDTVKLVELTGMIYLAGVPTCNCGNDGKALSVHSDGCVRKAYFKVIADEKTAEEIYAGWAYYPEDGREYIIYRLSELNWDIQYAEKLAALQDLIGAVVDQEIEAVLPGGNAVQISGEMPENVTLESGSVSEEAKNYVLENLLHSMPVNRENWNTFAFDLKIMNDGVVWQPTEDGVEVTIGGIAENADHVEIIHLLDSEDAIEAERAAGRLLSYTAEDIPSGFEAETAASGDANLIYYAFVSPDKVRINEDGSVTFTASSFSKYIFSVTSGGTNYTYEIGEGDYMLASILKALNVGKTVDDVKCTIEEKKDANGVRSQVWQPVISTSPTDVFTFTSQVEKLDNPNPELTDEDDKIFVLRDYRLARTDTGKKTDSIYMTINFKDDSSITINISKAQTYNKWPTGTSDNGYNAELSAANGIPTFVISGEQTYEATAVSSSVIWVLEQGAKVTMLGSVDVSNKATLKIMGEGTICNAIGTEAANYGVMFDLQADTTMNVGGEGSGIVFDGQSGITVEPESDNKDKIGKYSGVAIYMTSATLTMNNAAIKNMYNTYSSNVGTGIHCKNNLAAPNRITLTDVEVSNCLNRTGHSVLLINGFVQMTDCSFINNCNNSNYAGIIKASGSEFCQLKMNDCEASGNYSEGWGGLILWAAGAETTSNSATNKTSWAELDGCEFYNNRARYLGGAISNEAVMKLTNCDIHHNTAAAGGGIAVFPFTLVKETDVRQNAIGLTLGSGNIISNNTATATANFLPDFVVSTNDNVSYPVGGGGIWYYMNLANFTASLDIGSGNVIKDNTAASGGGIYVHRTAGESAVLNIEGATITGNTATYGGGVALVDATLNVTSGKIDGNTATDGGGVYIKESDNASFESVINVSGEGSISDNVAKNNGGGVYVTNGAEMTVNGGLIITNKAGENAGKADSEYTGENEDNDGFSGDTVAADAGNRVGGGVYVGKNSSFTMNGFNIGIFKNKAAVAADDVYASGEGTSIVLPAVDDMTLMGQFGETEEPTGWFEDYMLGDENHGTALTDGSGETWNTGRYRYADFTHMVAEKKSQVESRQFACITLGLMKVGTGSLTIIKDVVDEDDKSIDSDQVFVFKVQETKGSSYTFFTTITGAGTVTINEVPTGEYTVTELVEWAGRYTNTLPGEEKDYLQTVVIKEGATDASCSFTNRLDEDLWLDDNTDVVTNTYTAASVGEGD